MTHPPITRADRLLGVDDMTLFWEVAAISRNAARAMERHRQSRRPLCLFSPRERATYERIDVLRQEIGVGDFDVVQAVRDIREDDDL